MDEPHSAFSDDEEELEAQQAMEEWVDEVNRLLGGEARRDTPRRKPKEAPKRLHGHKRTLSSVPPLPPIAEVGTRPTSLFGAPTMTQWLTPMRSPPRPPQTDAEGHSAPSTSDSETRSRSDHTERLPAVKWRRYYQPLPSPRTPPTEPLPPRPAAQEVPVDIESRPGSLLPSYLTYSSPTQLPAYIRPISAHMPTVVFRAPTVQSMACEIEST
ncbi:hypothetical protein MCAP1_001000 [Malassezia caprae]|uniref:Uncharacterized protein n=1 Tax=Malassezia caprae TaxID=1381934 RepID=A0AAF0IUH6_9BASI|nr:hypothetical protein MCAP1_001000 [Malassezia caprae]